MGGEWKHTYLGEHVDLLTGFPFRSSEFLEIPGVRLARGDNVKRGFFDWSDGKAKYWPSVSAELEQYLLEPGDVLIGMDGSRVGENWVRVTESDLPCLLVQRVARLRARLTLDQRFLRFLVGVPAFSAYVKAVHTGTSIPHISGEQIRRFPIVLPPLREQKAIACILGALDDKIDLNRRMNRSLEGIARAIFKSWFVDFDPVHAKAAGQKPPGLKPDLAALFPDAFENPELGPIPKGWHVTSLSDQITASKGLSYKGQHLCEPGQGLPMHNLNSVYEGGGYKNEGLKWYKGEYRPSHLLKPGDVIVTNTEQGFDYLLIGYAAIIPERYGPQGLFSHHIYRIQPKDTSYLPPWFIYLLLRTPRFHDVVAGHSNGTTVNMLPLDGLQKPRFVLPPEEIVERFELLFMSTQQRLEQIHDENMSLAALRDKLSPKLISGELPVKDAERIVGRCA